MSSQNRSWDSGLISPVCLGYLQGFRMKVMGVISRIQPGIIWKIRKVALEKPEKL